jgi:hypothetical protein
MVVAFVLCPPKFIESTVKRDYVYFSCWLDLDWSTESHKPKIIVFKTMVVGLATVFNCRIILLLGFWINLLVKTKNVSSANRSHGNDSIRDSVFSSILHFFSCATKASASERVKE